MDEYHRTNIALQYIAAPDGHYLIYTTGGATTSVLSCMTKQYLGHVLLHYFHLCHQCQVQREAMPLGKDV